jgi:hypothetical protein
MKNNNSSKAIKPNYSPVPRPAKPESLWLNRSMPVTFGKVQASVFGGPFIEYVPDTRRIVGIKMAVEISHTHDFAVDTKDFNVPSQQLMQQGILYGLQKIMAGNDLYVGCMGGTGRTGLYMACMAKVMLAYAGGEGNWGTGEIGSYGTLSAPVAYVRKHYKAHAVETQRQESFVAAFDEAPALAYLKKTLEPAVTVKTVYTEVPVEKIVYVFNPFMAVASWFK